MAKRDAKEVRRQLRYAKMTFFRLSQNLLGYFAISSIAAILLLPALLYSLDTPFGLVDRNSALPYKLIDKEKFDDYLDQTFIFTDPERLSVRFRPFMDIWNGLIWKYWGDDGFFSASTVGCSSSARRPFSLPPLEALQKLRKAAGKPYQTDCN